MLPLSSNEVGAPPWVKLEVQRSKVRVSAASLEFPIEVEVGSVPFPVMVEGRRTLGARLAWRPELDSMPSIQSAERTSENSRR